MQPPRRIPRWIFALLALGLFFFGALVFLSRSSGSEYAALPSLTFTDLNGKEVALDDLRGQVVLVNNFATWCSPCQAEMPELQAFYEQHKERGFTIVAIESGEPAEVVAGFVKEFGITFPVLLDPQGKAQDAFNMVALPNSILVDREGKIRQTWIGAVDHSILEQAASPLIGK